MGCICAKGVKSEKKSGKANRSKKYLERLSPSSSRKGGGIEVPANGGGDFSRVGEEGIELQAVNEGNSSHKDASVESSSLEGTVVEVDNGSDEDTMLLIRRDGNESSNFSTTTSEEPDDEIFGFGKRDAPQSPRKERMPSGWQGRQDPICTALNVRNGVDGAQVVAGWPSWLSSVAGEALRGWIPRKLDSFEKLEKIGQGTYSDVYRARDLETGKMVALKKLHFKSVSQESACFMSREILILRMLNHPNVMKLEGLITSRFSNSLHLIFEYMEHDLAGLAASSCELSEPQIKCYMQQLFRGLEHCHGRGVLHRDIKCSNLLIGNNGNLKIADFGLSTYFCPDERRPRSTCVVTLWYRPPELLLGYPYYGTAVDLWSSGCILAELYKGKAIMPGRTEVEQLHKIFKLCGSPSEQYWKKLQVPHAATFKPPHPYSRRVSEVFKDLSPSALALLESILVLEPELRGSATSALQSEFFSTGCQPCDPSSLPKYPPSKEMNVRVRNEATQRWSAMGGRGTGLESPRKCINEFSDVIVPRSNAEFKASKKKWKGKSVSNISKYSAEEDDDSCFTLQLSKGYSQISHALQIDASGNLEKVGDEESHFNSSTPFHPSEYIELKLESPNKPPQMATASRLPLLMNSVLGSGSDNDNDNSKLHYGGETGVGMHVHQEQSLNTENGHTNDANLSESNHVLTKAEQSLNTGNEHTDDAKLSESIHVLEKPEQSLNTGTEHTDDAKISESIRDLKKPDQSLNTGNEHTYDAMLSESNHVLENPEQSLDSGNKHTDDANCQPL